MPPQRDVGFEAALDRSQTQFLQPRALQRQRRHVGYVSQCPAMPQAQGFGKTASRCSGPAFVECGLASRHQPLKPASINVISRDGDHVAAAPALEHHIRAECGTQPGDI